jgi:quercetin dioxygenase-like cupin family protein
MQINRHNSTPTTPAPEPTFTGDVQLGDYFRRQAPSRLAGARTPWKINPLGQTIIVTNGVGRAQAEGEEMVEIHTGDLLWFPPGQRHWEGASPDSAMTYVALQEEANGIVQFLAQVTDTEYTPHH